MITKVWDSRRGGKTPIMIGIHTALRGWQAGRDGNASLDRTEEL
jgi:hypothetical protein